MTSRPRDPSLPRATDATATADEQGRRPRTKRRGSGEGSIYFVKSRELWRAAVTIHTPSGRRRKWLSARTRAEVAEKLASALHARVEGTLRAGRTPTLGEFLALWLEGLLLEPSTVRGYEQVARVHLVPTLGHIRLDRLSPIDVDRMLHEKERAGLSAQTRANIRSVLRSAISFAVRKGITARNVVKLSEPVKTRVYEATYLTRDEASALLEAAEGDRLEALYSVAIPLGLRQGEILGLRWDDVDLEAKQLHVRVQLQFVKGTGFVLKEPKWHSKRTIPLPDITLRALRAHKIRQVEERLRAGTTWQDHGLVFATEIGTPISATNLLKRSFKPILAKAELRRPVRFHDLRHSAATLLLTMGVPLKVISVILGHSTTRMTERYAAVVPELAREAAAAMDRALLEKKAQ